MNEVPILKGKKILITGASSGLGLAMAKALVTEGASVIITARHADKLQKAEEQLLQLPGEAIPLIMNVRDEASIQTVVQWVKDNWNSLDVLINNAGLGMRTVNPAFLLKPEPFYKVSAEGFRNVIDTNLTGYFLVAKAFVPFFLAKNEGKIINISMNHETMKRKGFIPYGPSRAGAESLSYIMAEDLREAHIDVNMLLPGGATETDMIPEEYKKSIRLPLLQPEIMAKPIVFLASAQSNGISGERIVATEFEAWKQKWLPLL